MSNIKVTTLSKQDGSASVPTDTVINGTAKAWVNFNGAGMVAIRAAFNVFSITDNGQGQYTVNFITAMPDTNYSVVISDNGGSETFTGAGNRHFQMVRTRTVNAFQLEFLSDGGTAGVDSSYVGAAVFR